MVGFCSMLLGVYSHCNLCCSLALFTKAFCACGTQTTELSVLPVFDKNEHYKPRITNPNVHPSPPVGAHWGLFSKRAKPLDSKRLLFGDRAIRIWLVWVEYFYHFVSLFAEREDVCLKPATHLPRHRGWPYISTRSHTAYSPTLFFCFASGFLQRGKAV